MERLTVKTGVYQDDGHREVAGMKCGVELKDIFDRLAAIEDILGDEYDLDRLCGLVQADREGKIPKYTIGDTIYDRFGNAWEVTAVERRLLAGEPKWIYRCGHIGTNDYYALWEFEVLTHAEAQAALRREQDG